MLKEEGNSCRLKKTILKITVIIVNKNDENDSND